MYFSIWSAIVAALVPAAAEPAGASVFCVNVFPEVIAVTGKVTATPSVVLPLPPTITVFAGIVMLLPML